MVYVAGSVTGGVNRDTDLIEAKVAIENDVSAYGPATISQLIAGIGSPNAVIRTAVDQMVEDGGLGQTGEGYVFVEE